MHITFYTTISSTTVTASCESLRMDAPINCREKARTPSWIVSRGRIIETVLERIATYNLEMTVSMSSSRRVTRTEVQDFL